MPYHRAQFNSAFHPSGVNKSSTSFGWGKGGKVAAARWCWVAGITVIPYGMWSSIAVWRFALWTVITDLHRHASDMTHIVQGITQFHLPPNTNHICL